MKKLLILIHKKPNDCKDNNWQPFKDAVSHAINSPDIKVDIEALREFIYQIDEGGMHIYNPDSGIDLSSYDFVIFRLIRNERSRMGACTQLLISNGIQYIDTMYKPGAYSKLSSEFRRSANNIPNIPTIFAEPDKMLNIFNNNPPFQYPFILKDINGRRGKTNYLVDSNEHLKTLLQSATEGIELMAQRFIPNDGDYRCLVMGGKLRLVIKRKAVNGSHLNNTSQGGQANLVPITTFSSKVIADVEKAALIENIEVAGVDLLFDKDTGEHYILEVNSSPQLMTGAFPDIKLKEYAGYIREVMSL